jgi:hypothetical protein
MNLDGWKLEREIWVFEIVTNYVVHYSYEIESKNLNGKKLVLCVYGFWCTRWVNVSVYKKMYNFH